ncbi:hypothetical protein [Robiginitalea sp. SC105]|uniref:hypothetical protein n=1 Tax=Robiginitalea sp. SC105 TaxID=2762332 RepID=UPI00163A5650|nr:hypothetical protein [Robiginitalea sp. SC105]MBC2839607.1 hypothetical protein [Robiginitalea sp. SC105]
MLLKISAFLICASCFFTGRAQFNSYKYMVVPTRFEDFRKTNQHQTSTILKYYLVEKGLPAVYDAQQPKEIKVDPCQAAYVNLRDESGMFQTRVVVEFSDCEGNILLETRQGSSKIKDYDSAYKEAIADALESLSGVKYTYNPPATAGGDPAVAASASVAATRADVADSPSREMPVEEEAQTGMAEALDVARDAVPEGRESPAAAGGNPAASTAMAVAAGGSSAAAPANAVADQKTAPADLLYAQEIENGYQLVDSTPKVRMKLMETSQPDRFIALVDGQPKGMVYQQGTQWVHEFYEAGELRTEALQIKF